MNPTLQINGTAHPLTFDNRARFRFGQLGGSIPALLTPGQDYYQVCVLLYSALPDAIRSSLRPEDIAPHVDPTAVEAHGDALRTAIETWYPHGIETGPVDPDALAMTRPLSRQSPKSDGGPAA